MALPAWSPLARQEPKAVFPSALSFPQNSFSIKQSGTQISIGTKMVSSETHDKNHSFKTFSLQPREQSHAFYKDRSPEPKDSHLLSKSGINQRFWNRWKVLFEELRACFMYFPISYSHIILVLHLLLPVFTEVKHFLGSYFSLQSSFLQGVELSNKQLEDGSGIFDIVGWRGLRIISPSIKVSPLEII